MVTKKITLVMELKWKKGDIFEHVMEIDIDDKKLDKLIDMGIIDPSKIRDYWRQIASDEEILGI